MTLHVSMVEKGESWVGWSKHVEGWATHHEHNKVTCTLPARLVVSTHTSVCLTGEVRLVSWAGSSKGFTSCTPAARSSTSNRVYYQQHSLLEAADIVLEHLLSSPPGVHMVSCAGRGCTPRGWERARLARSPQLWAGYLCPGVFTQELTCNKQWKEELELLALTNG